MKGFQPHLSLEKIVENFQFQNYGKRYVGASLSKLELPPQIIQQVYDFMKNPVNMLVFLSKPGVGKTHLCSALTEWIVTNFETYRCWKEEDLLSTLRHSIGEGNGEYIKTLQQKTDYDLVILDDVGSGIDPNKHTNRDLEWRKEILFSFLDRRYNCMKPTIITSNFNKSAFQEIYHSRVVSRLFAAENTVIRIFDDSCEDLRTMGL